jgi:hypothetical protein
MIRLMVRKRERRGEKRRDESEGEQREKKSGEECKRTLKPVM